MPRSARYSDSPLAAVRRYFGLTQPELGQFLGVSTGYLSRLEAGKRRLPTALERRLDPLRELLPVAAEAGATDPAPAPPLADCDPDPLRQRLAECRHEATALRWALRPLAAQAAVAAHWALARPRLLTVLPPPTPTDLAAVPPPADDHAAFATWFRRQWLLARPVALDPEAASRAHLLRLRAEALEQEAAALAELLGEDSVKQ